MMERDKIEELDPEKIIEEMREEYWRGLSESQDDSEEDSSQMLLALVGGERFAMDARLCRTITKAGKVTRGPRMPDYVLGVINLRGEIISVVDLAVMMGVPPGERDPKSRLVVVESQDVRIAFLVDRILGIEWTLSSRVQEPQTASSSLKSEYIQGHLAPVGDEGWTTCLDLPKLIHGQELSFRK